MKTFIPFFILFLFLNPLIISGQEIETVSGNPKLFKHAEKLYVTFDYSGLEVGKYGAEQAYIDYMKDDAEKRKKGTGDDWLKKWNAYRAGIYQPKFIELINLHVNYGNIACDTIRSAQNYELNIHTTFMEPGFNKNAKRSPAKINVIATISEINNPANRLIISMTGVPGSEAFGSYSPDHRRIEEAYFKCGKELAKFLLKVIY